jgi:type II secretory pathway pseudopilin PulG
MQPSIPPQVIEAYQETLQQGILGLAFLLAVVIVLLIVLAIFLVRNQNSAQASDNKVTETLASMLGTTVKNNTDALSGINNALVKNNEHRLENTTLLREIRDETIAQRKDLKAWPEATSGRIDLVNTNIAVVATDVKLGLTASLEIKNRLTTIEKIAHEILTLLTPSVSIPVTEPTLAELKTTTTPEGNE